MSPSTGSFSTRQRILAYLAENHIASADLLSQACRLTRADIRYHLASLLQEGIIEKVPQAAVQENRQPQNRSRASTLTAPARRGRPATNYRLADQALSHNLAGLCSALLDVLREYSRRAPVPAAWAPPDASPTGPANDPSQAESLLLDIAQALAGENAPVSDASRIRRLHACVARLTASGYRAAWEAGPSGPRVLLRACPYASILPDHPELCEIDRLLVQQLSGMRVAQTARINPLTGRPPACVFTSEA